ncbi:DUF86 domain-containing protein [Anaerotignum lactatifermentans]|uniref:DUF86 domain-containing protein n=2 Tax=Anaerotignum lactatifermentans TaxID=160404 RepID=A0ABS2G8P6_9FIRM|nr:HepT-like ribonuclease domain-containing protein [Anaerotignum lactatifermentans]MBM6829478.1 DUF86 domain-containing protein [Anaerotignum lactatifermentans]MBM6877836.1 DUF86 domain-containing protein [Anaerotignum lactatifermentans]MBM6951055.1 DUF86 domain-containing protein [Anaerotignum lactatifermentans]
MRADRNAEVLKHMVKYCDQIEETVLRFQKDFAVFAKDHIYQNAVALCVLQIGELTTKLTEEFKQTYTGMPWNQIKAMRNIVAHNYGSIDAEILWETIENDVPQLKAYCLDILQTLNNENR